VGLGVSRREADRIVGSFRTHDERRLIEDYKHASDMEKLRDRARSDVATLEKLFAEDAAEQERARDDKEAEGGAR
jgi:glutathione-regulated potassium-efflux system protein KefB